MIKVEKIDLSRDERSYTGSEAETITKYLKKWEKEVKNYKDGGDWGIDDSPSTPENSKYKEQFEEWKTLITSDKQGWFKNLEEYKELYPIYQFDQLVANYSWENSVWKIKFVDELKLTFKSDGSVEGLVDIDDKIKVMEYIVGKYFPDFESARHQYITKILVGVDVKTAKTPDELFNQWKTYAQDNSQLLELFNYDQIKLNGSDEVDNWKTSDQYLSYFHQKDIPLAEQKALEQDRFKEWKAENETLFKKVFKADSIKVKNLDSSNWITYKSESFLNSFKESYLIKGQLLNEYKEKKANKIPYLKKLFEFWRENKIDGPFDGYYKRDLPRLDREPTEEEKITAHLKRIIKWLYTKENNELSKLKEKQERFKKGKYLLERDESSKKLLAKEKEKFFQKDVVNFITLKQDNEAIAKWNNETLKYWGFRNYLDFLQREINQSPLLKGHYGAYKSLLFNLIKKEINWDNVPTTSLDLSLKKTKDELKFTNTNSLLHNHFWNWFKKNFGTIHTFFSNPNLEFFNEKWNKIPSWTNSKEFKKYKKDIKKLEDNIKEPYTKPELPYAIVRRFYFTLWAKENIDTLVQYLQASSIKVNGILKHQNLLLEFKNDYLIKKYLSSGALTQKDKLILESYKVKAIDNYLKINLPWKKAPTYSHANFIKWINDKGNKNVLYEAFNQSNYYINQNKKGHPTTLDGVVWTQAEIDKEYGPKNTKGRKYFDFFKPFVKQWVETEFKPKDLKPDYVATSFLNVDDVKEYIHIFQNNPEFKDQITEVFNEWVHKDTGRFWLQTHRSKDFKGYLNSQEFRNFIYNMITYDITKGGTVDNKKAKIFKSKHPFAQLVGFMLRSAKNDITVTDIPEHNKDVRFWHKWEYRAEFLNQKTLQDLFNYNKKNLVSSWQKIYDDKYKLVYDFLKKYQLEETDKTVALWATKEDNFASEAWKIWNEELTKSVKRFYLDKDGKLKNDAIAFVLGGLFSKNKIEETDYSIDTIELKYDLSDEELKRRKIEVRTKDEIVFIQNLPSVDRSPKNAKNWKIKTGHDFSDPTFYSKLVFKIHKSKLLEKLEFIARINNLRNTFRNPQKIATKTSENYYKAVINMWVKSEMKKYVSNPSNPDEIEKIKQYYKDLDGDKFDKWVKDLSTKDDYESIPYQYYKWEKIYQNLFEKDEFLHQFKKHKRYIKDAKSYWWDYDYKKVNYQKKQIVNTYLSEKERATIKDELKVENQAVIKQMPFDFEAWYEDSDLLYLDELMRLFEQGFIDPKTGHDYRWKPYDSATISNQEKRQRFYSYKRRNKDLFKKLFSLSNLEIKSSGEKLTSFALPHTTPLQYQWSEFFKSSLGQQKFYQKALPLVVGKVELNFHTQLDLKQTKKDFRTWVNDDHNLKYIKEFFKDKWASELPQINQWLTNNFPGEKPKTKQWFDFAVSEISNQEIIDAIILPHNHDKTSDQDFVDESSLNIVRDLLINHIASWYKEVKNQADIESPIYDFYQWWQVNKFINHIDTDAKVLKGKLDKLQKEVNTFKKGSESNRYKVHMKIRKEIIENFAKELSDENLLDPLKKEKIKLDYWNSSNNKVKNLKRNQADKDLVALVKKTSAFKVYNLYPSDQQLLPYLENWYYQNFEKIVASVVLHKKDSGSLRGQIYQAWINSLPGKAYLEKIKSLAKISDAQHKTKLITYHQRKYFDQWFLAGNTKLLFPLFKHWIDSETKTWAYFEAQQLYNIINSVKLNSDIGKIVVDKYRFTKIYHYINQYIPLFHDKASAQDFTSWVQKNKKSDAGKKFLKEIFTKVGKI